ncbi:hypothetical protein [Bdellovibrio sp. HCB2-146]|uniref:hypothetical protein n=1 Tax=Bdellovibrio sp. HCB2-146 TaxID=3394362 RepID=UPI0039BD628E
MKSVLGLISFAFAMICVLSAPAIAYETDQYTVPPAPLKDLGPSMSAHIYDYLTEAIHDHKTTMETLPSEILIAETKIKEFEKLHARDRIQDPVRNKAPEYIRKNYARLQQKHRELVNQYNSLQTQIGFIDFFRKKFYPNLVWQEQRDAVFGWDLSLFDEEENRDALFDPGKMGNIYSYANFHRLISPTYFVFSSTMNAYGHYFGTDKIGHFFAQGFQYYAKQQEMLYKGRSIEVGHILAIDVGTTGESGYFGKVADGVYSNADLATNYSGFKFYQNIFHEVNIGNRTLPPMVLVRADRTLMINPELRREEILAPFISDHFNEAFNPSDLEAPQRWVITKAIRNRCESFLRFYGNPTQAELKQKRLELSKFYGEEYGYKAEGTLHLDQICFTAEKSQ